MKKFYVLMVAVAIAFINTSCSYNAMVSKQEAVNTAWAQVENQYQRRADLIPNLVSTVKGYAKHEETTLTAVVEARTKATSVNIGVDNLDDASLAEFQKSQAELSQSLGRLIAVAEAYPELKANENFLELQAQLEGTENRIAVARKNFNNEAREYNSLIRKFPMILFSNIYGFTKYPYFTAEAGAEKAPKVEF